MLVNVWILYCNYFLQLEQIETALENAEEETDKSNLNSLKDDINQLIELTKESLNRLRPKVIDPSMSTSTTESNNIEDEFALFMVKIM